MGHNPQRLNHGNTHSVQKLCPQGVLRGSHLGRKHIAHSSPPRAAEWSAHLCDHWPLTNSTSLDEKPLAILRSPSPSEEIRPSNTEGLGNNGLDCRGCRRSCRQASAYEATASLSGSVVSRVLRLTKDRSRSGGNAAFVSVQYCSQHSGWKRCAGHATGSAIRSAPKVLKGRRHRLHRWPRSRLFVGRP